MKLFPKQSIMLSLFVLMFMLLSVLTVVIPHAFGFTMAIVTSDAMDIITLKLIQINRLEMACY